jgi:elongation factor Ts
MAEITAKLVKELRDRTQAGMSTCKEALVEAGGDIDKAIEILQKKREIKSASVAGKVATEGEVRTLVSTDKKRGTIVEVNCQTDFVSRGEDFQGFLALAVKAASDLPAGSPLPAALEQARKDISGGTGENVVVRRWESLNAEGAGGTIVSYVHMGGKIGVLLSGEAPSADAAKDASFVEFLDNCAMQIAAMSPTVVDKSQVAEAEIAKQKDIFAGQLKEEGKPEAAWPKIVEGKLAKWFTEVTLLGQDNVWGGEGTIDKIRAELGKKLGGEVKLHTFFRYGLGDGIEKKVDDLAAEVAKMTGG